MPYSDPEKQKEATAKWESEHTEKRKEYKRLWYQRNKQRCREVQNAYRRQNEEQDAIALINSINDNDTEEG